MAIKHIILLFVETPRKFITAKLSIRKSGSSSVLIIIITHVLHMYLLLHVFYTYIVNNRLKADFQSSHEAPRSSLRVHA
jgi:hypothetical protein